MAIDRLADLYKGLIPLCVVHFQGKPEDRGVMVKWGDAGEGRRSVLWPDGGEDDMEGAPTCFPVVVAEPGEMLALLARHVWWWALDEAKWKGFLEESG